MTTYDAIGRGYAINRRPDPRWASAIQSRLRDARTIVNIGAGAGSYEPDGVSLVAIEPSLTMIAQRPTGSAPVVRGVAGALPFPDRAFDAALAVLTVHHWPDPAAGLAEMRRVSRRQVVVTWDQGVIAERFWLVRDYLPEIAERERTAAAAATVAANLNVTESAPLPLPHDCTDGMLAAYWRRPEAYVDPDIRASISALALLEPAILNPAVGRLADDLRTGAWHRRYEDVLALDTLDAGYRVLVAES
jgi:SAM-dependent methyltransferase